MSSHQSPVLALVIPCFNEQLVLPTTAAKLQEELLRLISEKLISQQSCIYLVDDGSDDATWNIITALVDSDNSCRGIKLTRNFGHQYALYAGLMEAEGDVFVSMDADLQDDLTVIRKMLLLHREGCDIVFGVREDRSSDKLFKRWTAGFYYWLSAWLSIETIKNHADFRLMSQRAVAILGQYHEANLYLRGIIPLLGLKSGQVFYRREERAAGQSKYDFMKMLSLAVKGITSFSIVPLRIISFIGVLVFGISVVMGGWALSTVLFTDEAVPGWASTVIPIYLLGGLQLLAIGVAGEYIGRTYIEVKNRPRYLVDEVYQPSKDNREFKE